MPNLADSMQCSNFVNKLVHCEKRLRSMTVWEMEFIETLRAKFDERDTMLDLGVTPWNPSSSQWNTLGIICEAYP